MNIYKIFSSYETFTKSILIISILIVVILLFFNNDYLKIITIAKEEPKNNTLQVTEIPKNNTPQVTEIPKNNTPQVTEIPKNNTPQVTEIPKNNTPQVTEIPKNNTPQATEIPDVVAMIISKIISEEKLISNQISFNNYEPQEWNSTSMGCPRNGAIYTLSTIKGLEISININDQENIIHTDKNLNYINCSKINDENTNSDYNFYKKYNLGNTKKITLLLNSNNKVLSTLEDPEDVIKVTKALDININVKKVDSCESIYNLIFSSESQETALGVVCEGNLNYIETEESLETTNLFIKILEDLLSNIEFPGMPSNE